MANSPILDALVEATPLEGAHPVLSPGVGIWRSSLAESSVAEAGNLLGHLEILGQKVSVRLAAPWRGRLTRQAESGIPVAYGSRLFTLHTASEQEASPPARGLPSPGDEDVAEGWVLRAPSSGRLYLRPNPNESAFVTLGSEVEPGAPLALLEVMKTFTRLSYRPPAASRAQVEAIFVQDGAEVRSGQALMRLRPVA